MKNETKFDCQTCGACCISVYDHGVHVDLEEDDIQRLSAYYRRKYVVNDCPRTVCSGLKGLATTEHLDGYACVAFRGRVGRSCSCAIYDKRPFICQDFRPGGVGCLGARKDAGL